MIPGNIVLPILGTPKFAHRVKMASVETEIDGLMCDGCGEVIFLARDPQRIRKVYDAVMRVQGAT